MNKDKLFEKLKAFPLDKSKIIIISGASLLAQNIIDSSPDIDIVTSTKYYNSIGWPEKIGAFGKKVKYFDVFEISDNLYDENAKTLTINGFKFLNIADILKIKLALNRKKDQQIIKKLTGMINGSISKNSIKKD